MTVIFTISCVCNMNTDVHRGQKWVLDPQKLELQVVVSCLVWVLGAKLGPLEEW